METWLVEHPGEIGTTSAASLRAAGYKKSSTRMSMYVGLNPTRRGYCIAAHRVGGSGTQTWHYLVYDSLSGGLNGGKVWDWSSASPPGAAACSGANSAFPLVWLG